MDQDYPVTDPSLGVTRPSIPPRFQWCEEEYPETSSLELFLFVHLIILTLTPIYMYSLYLKNYLSLYLLIIINKKNIRKVHPPFNFHPPRVNLLYLDYWYYCPTFFSHTPPTPPFQRRVLFEYWWYCSVLDLETFHPRVGSLSI